MRSPHPFDFLVLAIDPRAGTTFTFLAILAPPQDLADSPHLKLPPPAKTSNSQAFYSAILYCRAALAIHLVSKMLGPIRSALGSIALLALVSSTSAASSSTNTVVPPSPLQKK